MLVPTSTPHLQRHPGRFFDAQRHADLTTSVGAADLQCSVLDAQRAVARFGADLQTKIADSLGPIIDMKSSLGPPLIRPDIPDYSHVLAIDDTLFQHQIEEYRATVELPGLITEVVTAVRDMSTQTTSALEKLEAKIEEGQIEQAAHNRKQLAHNELQAFHNRRESRKTTWLIGLAVATVIVGALGWARHSDSPPAQGPAPVHVQHVTTSPPGHGAGDHPIPTRVVATTTLRHTTSSGPVDDRQHPRSSIEPQVEVEVVNGQ